MTFRHVCLAVLVAVCWGLNFVSVKFAFTEMPPFMFLTIRLFFTAFPLIFFIPKPNVKWSTIAQVTLYQWILHFVLLFSGVYTGVGAGLSSLLAQTSILFTILLSAFIYKQNPNSRQMMGLMLALVGLVMISVQNNCQSNILGIVFILGAALSNALASITFRSIKNAPILPVMVWSSMLAIVPMGLLSLIFEGPDMIVNSAANVTYVGLGALAYSTLISTFVGILTWAKLMNQCEPSKVAPYSLLIPVVSMTASYFILDECITSQTLIASVIVIVGLVMNQFNLSLRFKPVKMGQGIKPAVAKST